MAARWTAGPVFAYEWAAMARRWQTYAARALFLALILIGLAITWYVCMPTVSVGIIRSLAVLGTWFFYTMVAVQLAFVLLAAPAITAGAICTDRAKGPLTHLLVTDLSSAEIVLGKLAARLAPLLGLLCSTLPVLAISTLLGGVDPDALLSAFLVALGCAVLGCTISLVFSVWSRKAHEVLLASYSVIVLWLLIEPALRFPGIFGSVLVQPSWLWKTNPVWLTFAPYQRPTSASFADAFVFLMIVLGASAGLAALATFKLRAVSARMAGEPRIKTRPWRVVDWLAVRFPKLPSPSLDRNPVAWREWHRSQPSRLVKRVWLAYATIAFASTAVVVGNAISSGTANAFAGAWLNGFQTCIGLLLLSAHATTALAEERAHGSLDLILSTPLATRTILWGKWWGTLGRAWLLVILPQAVVIAMVPAQKHWTAPFLYFGLFMAYTVAIVSLGLALSTWIARLSRALAVSVGVYVIVTVGWLFIVLSMFGPGSHRAGYLSPFYGFAELTFATGQRGYETWANEVNAAFVAMVVYASASLALMGWTLVTFDRCLGRMPDQFVTRRFNRLRKPRLNTVRLAD